MITTLRNNRIAIGVHSHGAELRHVTDIETGFEFMWQADPEIWGRSSPLLFPMVGKLKEDTIIIQGKPYSMSQHGFARDREFVIETQNADQIGYVLTSDSETLSKFPYPFKLRIGYQLEGNCLRCIWSVTNTGKQLMYFSIGAHPGFALIGHKSEDYFIEWENEEIPKRYMLTNGLFNGKTETVHEVGKILPLNSQLFDHDALVFKDLHSTQLRLVHRHSSHSIKMDFRGFPYLGIWCKKGCNAFICIEPWYGCADHMDGNLDISQKPGILQLKASEEFEAAYTMEFIV
ncbi:MAG: aldose 1-epimerase family protein [Bacteroidia bacterium]